MNLKAEDRAVGKENFHAAIGSDLTRRQFLAGTVAAAAGSGAGLGSMYFGYEAIKGNPVRIGVIGTGDEGSVLIGAHTPDYVDIVAIADIRPFNVWRAFHGDYASPNANAARPGLIKRCGYPNEAAAKKHVRVYDKDYLDLLKDPNVEAVIIALPLHLHDVVAIQALALGKHVLTEKLMAHSVHQCKEMGRVAYEKKLHLATGHQRHYSILYDNAVKTVQKGLIGDIHHIRAQWHRNNQPKSLGGSDSWAPLLPADLLKDLPKELAKIDKDLAGATGSKAEMLQKKKEQLENQVKDAILEENDAVAKKYGYQSKTLSNGYSCSPLEELIRWRLWNRTGGGLMAELGSHQLDAAGIFCTAARMVGKSDEDAKKVEKARPLTVTAVGGRHIFPEDREVDDHVYCTYEFPAPNYDAKDPELQNKKIVVTYSSINGNPYGNYGEVVMGTKATLILEAEQEVMLFSNSGTATSVKVSKSAGGPTLDTTTSGGPSISTAIGKAALGEGPVSRGYTEEIEHWAWCIRSFDFENNKPKCHPAVAMADAIIALTTNIAIKEQRRIEFKPEWFDIDNDETPEGVAPRSASEVLKGVKVS